MANTVLSTLHALSHLILTILQGRYHCPHFTLEITELTGGRARI